MSKLLNLLYLEKLKQIPNLESVLIDFVIVLICLGIISKFF